MVRWHDLAGAIRVRPRERQQGTAANGSEASSTRLGGGLVLPSRSRAAAADAPTQRIGGAALFPLTGDAIYVSRIDVFRTYVVTAPPWKVHGWLTWTAKYAFTESIALERSSVAEIGSVRWVSRPGGGRDLLTSRCTKSADVAMPILDKRFTKADDPRVLLGDLALNDPRVPALVTKYLAEE